MNILLVILIFSILLTWCTNTQKQENIVENKRYDYKYTKENIRISKQGNEIKVSNIKTQKKIKNVISISLKQKIIQDIKNVKAMWDFEMMRFDCSVAKMFPQIYKICTKEKEAAKKRYWTKIKQRNQKIASFTLKDCEIVIGKRYKTILEQVGKVPARDLLFALPPSENLTPDKLDNLSKEEIKKLIYKQMQHEINQCKLWFAFQKNMCDKLEDKNLKQECKKLKDFWEMKIKLEQVERFNVADYIQY